MLKWFTALYLRLSSEDGDKQESDSITNQKKLIELFLKKNKDIKIVDYYIDDGYSGTDFNRPAFQRLLNDVKDGKINCIIVKDLSRFGRNYIEVGNYIEQIFPLYNLRFIAVNDNIDSYKDPKSINNVIVPFKNLMNDEYARDISNKVKSTLNTKKVGGDFVGKTAPYGYLKNPKNKHKFIIDNKASKIVKKIFKMILDGKSKAQIVEDLNKHKYPIPSIYKQSEGISKERRFKTTGEWNTEMIDRILKNRAYLGEIIQGRQKRISHKIHKRIRTSEDEWIVIENHHEAIISKDTFEQVQDVLYSRDNRVNKNNEYDSFSGHLKCADCGNTLTVRKAKNHVYYYCTSYIKNKVCTKHSITKDRLEEITINVVNNHIKILVDLEDKINNITLNNEVSYDVEILNNRLEELDKSIFKYETLKDSVKDDYYNKIITKEECNEYQSDYNNTIMNLKKERDTTAIKLNNLDYNSKENKVWLEHFIKNKELEKINKKVVDEIIDNIYIYENGNINIKFKYQDEFFEAMDFIKSHKCDIINNEFLLEN